jgi:hypothetical protein
MNWRSIGPTTLAAFEAEIRARAPRSPLLAEVEAIYQAVREHSRLFLGMCWIEDQFQTDPSDNFPISYHNLMNMKTPDGGGWMQFDSYAAGAKGWIDRITSPTYKNGIYARTETVEDLINVYAPPFDNNDVPNYVATIGIIVAELIVLEKELGGTDVADLVFGKVPHPQFTDRPIPESRAWDNLGKRTVRAVVWHRMLGSLWGTDGYFRGEAKNSALTDYGVGVAAQDGTDNDGLILRWNDPQGNRSPWANGRVSAPYGDGLAFVNRYGTNAVNRDATAIEISGFQNTPLSEKSRDAICGITAYWADQAKIPYDTFPAVPGENRSFVIWHQEFTIGTGKECPFAVVMNETNALIERTRAILKKYQTASTKPTPKPPTYADPIIPDWLTEDLKDGKPNDHIWDVEIDGKITRVEVFAAHRPFTMVKGANRLQLPFAKAKKVGPRLEVRETFMGRNAARVGSKVFVQTEWGTWADNAAMTPRISIRKA